MNRSRLTPAGLGRLVERLSDRDLDIVLTLRRVRVATAGQIERLHFVDGTALSNARQCRRTLTRLTELHVVHRLERRIGGVRAGSASFVYSLGIAGQRLAGARGPAGGRRVRRPWTPSGPFVAHALDVTELYVRIIETQRTQSSRLERFDTEPDAWRTSIGPGGERLILKPDAFVITTNETFEDRWFIEVDRNTESPTKLARHADRYRHYWQSGTEQHASGMFPKVLFVVPDPDRAETVNKTLARQPAEAWPLFAVVTFNDAAALLAGIDP
jgi:hypothetical protein